MSPIGLPSSSRTRRSELRPRRSILPYDRAQQYYRKEYKRDPTEEELADTITWHENRLVPLCYYLASVDAARAERMAAAIHNPHLRAYAVGMVAKALAPSDKAKARRLILQAYDILAEACRNPDRRWPQRSWRLQRRRPLPRGCCRLSRRSIRRWSASAYGGRFLSACIGRPTTSWCRWSRKPTTPRWPLLWRVTIARWPVRYCPAWTKR